MKKYLCQSLAFGWFENCIFCFIFRNVREYFGSKQPILALTSNACTFYVDEVFWWWFSYLQSRMMTRKIARNKRTLNKTLLFSGNFFRLGAFFNPLSAISNLFVNPFIRRIILGFMPYKKAFCWKICQVPGNWAANQTMSIFLADFILLWTFKSNKTIADNCVQTLFLLVKTQTWNLYFWCYIIWNLLSEKGEKMIACYFSIFKCNQHPIWLFSKLWLISSKERDDKSICGREIEMISLGFFIQFISVVLVEWKRKIKESIA